jgi:hypothetical protein
MAKTNIQVTAAYRKSPVSCGLGRGVTLRQRNVTRAKRRTTVPHCHGCRILGLLFFPFGGLSPHREIRVTVIYLPREERFAISKAESLNIRNATDETLSFTLTFLGALTHHTRAKEDTGDMESVAN